MASSPLGLLLVAAGTARRMGGIDKAWADLGGHPVVRHSVRTLGPSADVVVVVVRSDQRDLAEQLLGGLHRRLTVVEGGPERYDSVGRGLDALGDVETVAIHDAARPFATEELLSRGLACLTDWDGAVPGVPVSDTIKLVSEEGEVQNTVDRHGLRAIQTPQVFDLSKLREARSRAPLGGQTYTDDGMVMEQAGFRVGVFPGMPWNLKITTPKDLEVARILLSNSKAP